MSGSQIKCGPPRLLWTAVGNLTTRRQYLNDAKKRGLIVFADVAGNSA